MNQFNTKKNSRVLFYGLLAMLLCLCFVRYSLQVNIPRAVLLVVAVLMALLGDRDQIVAVCVACIPLHTSFHYTYVLLFCLVIYVTKYSGTIRINLSVVPILLMILWELLHCFGSPFSVTAFVNDCMPLLVLAVLLCNGAQGYDYDMIVRVLAVSTAAMCMNLVGQLLFTTGFDFQAAFSNLKRLGMSTAEMNKSLLITGGNQNPNTLGIICVLASAGLLQLRTSGRGKTKDMILLAFLIVFGMMTSSRTYLACLLIMLVLLLFSQKGSLVRKLRFLCTLIVSAVVLVALLWLIFPDLMNYYYGRFFMADLSTGRLDLMQIYHRYIISNRKALLFGIGLHDFYNKVLTEYRIAVNVPHNGIQELVLAWGIPGMCLFALMGMAMIRQAHVYCGKLRLLNFIPLIIILAKAQVGQMLDSAYTMLAFSYAYLSLCADLSNGASPGRPGKR